MESILSQAHGAIMDSAVQLHGACNQVRYLTHSSGTARSAVLMGIENTALM